MKTILLTVLLTARLSTLSDAAQPKPTPPPEGISPGWNEAETWVIKQIQAGESADLSAHFPGDKSRRTIHARFLQDLLTGELPGVKPRRIGIRIGGAVVAEPVDLTSAEMSCDVFLVRCHFEQAATFIRSIFVKAVSFEASEFAAETSFSSARVGGDAFFKDVVFDGAVDFSNAVIGNEFWCEKAQFKDAGEGANFDGFKVGGSAGFDEAVFSGPADFGSADISGEFSASATRFLSKDKTANFDGLKVGSIAYFSNAVFSGPTDFDGAVIASDFKADDAQFLDTVTGVSFGGTQVKAEASFDRAVFAGRTSFYYFEADGAFHLDGAHFQDIISGVRFDGMKAKSFVSIEKSVFAGPATFIFADIACQFKANGTRFQDIVWGAIFNSMKVGSIAFFSNAVFFGPADFQSADVASQFQVNDTRFENKEKVANFNGMKVGSSASFCRVFFAGKVNLADATFQDLAVSEMPPGIPPIPRLDLSRTVIKRNLRLSRLRIAELLAPSLHVEGSAAFEEIEAQQLADLRYGDFDSLNLTQSQWPSRESGKLQLQGTSYRSVSAASYEPVSHDALLKLADQAAYTADVYSNLAGFFVRQGYTDDANRAYVAGRSRERGEAWTWHSFHPLNYTWDLILQGIGYGRYPERAVYVCILIVVFGCWIFKPAKMEPQRNEDGARQKYYNRFWYSLELFLPLVELKAVDAWEPKLEYRFLRHYMRIHTLLGWILIPIALGSVTGLIK